MSIRKEFEYYHHLQKTVTSALLHLLIEASYSKQYLPVHRRNEILVKFLKPLLKCKHCAGIKKDIRSWITIARTNGRSLEQKLYAIHSQTNRASIEGSEKFYLLLEHLYDSEKIECKIYQNGMHVEQDIIYILEDDLEHCFDSNNQQIAPLSFLVQSKKTTTLIELINKQGGFTATLYEWNPTTQQAHIHLHPSIQQ